MHARTRRGMIGIGIGRGLLAVALFANTACPTFATNRSETDDLHLHPKTQAPDFPNDASDGTSRYGLDTSFPVHYPFTTNGDEGTRAPSQMLGDKRALHKEFMEGCREYYGDDGYLCDVDEKNRLAINRIQPKGVMNYTDVGFQKMRAPPEMYKLLVDFWEANRESGSLEEWEVGEAGTNYWEAPAYMVSVSDESLHGGGDALEEKLWDASRNIIKEWTDMPLVPTSIYGMRVYTEGAILVPHVDRFPLISSAIINVAQDVDEDWPLEVYGHDGRVHNVTMQPGDMVLYESHSLVHGRPFPLQGRYYANIFIHFEPVSEVTKEDGDELPFYIIKGSDAEMYWRQTKLEEEIDSLYLDDDDDEDDDFKHAAHYAASVGDMKTLANIANENLSALFEEDELGLQPIHEAARRGQIDSVHFLVHCGADVNAQAGGGSGSSPLWWALKYFDVDHPVVLFLRDHDAINIKGVDTWRQ